MQTAKTASLLAAATAFVFLLLLGVVLVYGVSQQYFELVHSPEKYTEELVEHSKALNIIFVLDNIFIILYTSTAFFTIKTVSKNAPSFVSLSAYILIAAVGLLDFLENFHIYSLMQQVNGGITVTAHEIQWQSIESMMKWHLAYFAFFMLGFLMPSKSFIEKLLKYSLLFWFVPTGILVYATVDTKYADLFQWLRYLNLFSGFIMICFMMRKINSDS
jgi:hypothetical protein